MEMNTTALASRIAAGWPWLLMVMFFAVPLAIDTSGLWAFLPVKTALLVAGSGIALALAIVSWALGGLRHRGIVASDLPLMRAAGVTVAWLVLVPFLTAPNPHLHFLGAVQLLATAGLGGLALVAVGCVGEDWRRRFLGAFAAAGGVIAMIALLQASGADPIELIAGGPLRAEGRWRVVATLGNPTWTGEFLAAVLPVTLFVLRRSFHGRWSRVFEWSVAIFFAAAVLATGSRLAAISLFAGLAVWAIAGRSSEKTGPGRLPRSVAVAVLVALVAAGLLLGASITERWLHLDSIKGRVGLAGASSELVLRHPVTGHGLDHYRVVLPDGLRAFAERMGERSAPWMPRTLVDHADSDVLEMAVEGGIPAAVLMLVLWALTLRRAFTIDGFVGRAVGASMIALAVSSLGSSPLHTPATALLFWVLVGLIAAASEASTKDCSVGSPAGGRPGISASRRFIRGAALVGAVVLALIACRFAVEVVINNRRAKAAQSEVANGRYDRAEEVYRRILSATPWDGESRLNLGALLIARADYDRGLALVRSSQRWSASQRAWLLDARALAATGKLDEGIVVLEDAVAALPEGRALLVELGELYLAADNRDAAADVFRRALASKQRAPGAEELNRRARAGLSQTLN